MDVYKLKCIYEGNEDFVLTVAENIGQAKKNIVKYYIDQNKNKFVDIVAVISGFLNANRTDLYGLKNETVIWLLKNVYHTIFESKVQNIFCSFNSNEQVQLKVCNLNGNAIQFIENPSKDVIIASIKSNPESIAHLDEYSADIIDVFIESLQEKEIQISYDGMNSSIRNMRIFDLLKKCLHIYKDNEIILKRIIQKIPIRLNGYYEMVSDIAKIPYLSSSIQLELYKKLPILVMYMGNVSEDLQLKVIEEQPYFFRLIQNRTQKAVEYARERCKQALLDGSYSNEYILDPQRFKKSEELSGLGVVDNIDQVKFSKLSNLVNLKKRKSYKYLDYDEYRKHQDLYINDNIYIEIFKRVYKSYDKERGWNYYELVELLETIIYITTDEGIKFSIKCKGPIDDVENQKYLYGMLELFEINY